MSLPPAVTTPPETHAATPTETYVDTPLQPGQIRVFHIKPARQLDDPIQGYFSVRAVLLTTEQDSYRDETSTPSFRAADWLPRQYDCARYIALSYAWGSPALTRHVLCGGRLIPVTESLYTALWRLRAHLDSESFAGHFDNVASYARKPTSRSAIWADGICIDQGHIKERNSQVQAMGQIYSSASLLVIWLGEQLEGLHTIPEKGLGLDVVRAILQAPWFKRRWVIQEFRSSPPNRYFLLGGQLQRTQDVELSLRTLTSVEAVQLRQRAGPMQFPGAHRAPLLQELIVNQDAVCSDPKDCVHALLGICPDATWLDVDYSRSWEEIYTMVARHYVQRRGTALDVVRLLAAAVLRTQRRGVPNETLPSWVPDWRQSPSQTLARGLHRGLQSEDARSLRTSADAVSRGFTFRHQSHTLKEWADQSLRIQETRFRLRDDHSVSAEGWLVDAALCRATSLDHMLVMTHCDDADFRDLERHSGHSQPLLGDYLRDSKPSAADRLWLPGCAMDDGGEHKMPTRRYWPAFVLRPAADRGAGGYLVQDCVMLAEETRWPYHFQGRSRADVKPSEHFFLRPPVTVIIV